MPGSFDDFFDFNHDGKLDALEWSAKMEFLDEISKDHSKDRSASNIGAGGISRRQVARPSRLVHSTSSRSSGTRVSQTNEEKSDPLVGFMMKMLLAIVCILIGCYAFKVIRHIYGRNEELDKVKSLMAEYESRVPEELPAYLMLKRTGHYKSCTTEGFPKMTKSSGSGRKYQFYHVTLDYVVTLHADQYFDDLSDRAKYDELEEIYQDTGKAYDVFMRRAFPEFEKLNGWTSVEGLSIRYAGGDCELSVETLDHLYQYSKYGRYFILDGEKHFPKD